MRVPDEPAVVTLPAEIEQDTAELTVDSADSVLDGVSPAYRALREAVASGAQVVVADLTSTTFCDYPAFRQLVAIHHLAATSDVQLRLAMPVDGAVRRWLEFLAHHRLVRVYPGLTAAKTALPAPERVIAALRADARHEPGGDLA
jgi:anti-anti-sigma regulatory factor